MDDRRILLTAAPLGLAIGVFGIIFGAAANAEFGAGPTLAMSLLVFSGTVQFAVVGLMSGGVGGGAVLLTVAALNARNLVLGASLRPMIDGSRLQRVLLSWFLIDESFGLAVSSGQRAARTLVLSGVLFYLTWQIGTILGVAGAQLVALEGIAEAVFPVLFVGLAAITAQGWDGVIRAIVAAALVLILTILVPSVYPFLPITAALLVALPGGRDR